MNRTRWVAGVAVLVIAGLALVWLRRGVQPAAYAHLRDPRVTHLPDQRMLVVTVVGDPNAVSGGAIKALFGAYYGLPGVSRWQPPPAPRARWAFAEGTPKAEWKGEFALPVSDRVSSVLPRAQGDRSVRLATWAYGDVAEILHVGAYNTEEPDILRLRQFVESSGYRVVGDHEEEYVKGPGMFFAGDPATYLTIIRLRVEPAAPVGHPATAE